MMKQTFALLLLLLVSVMLRAQLPDGSVSDPQPALIEFNGGKYNGYIIEFNSPPDLVEAEVKDKFKSQGVKPKKADDFLVFRNVILQQIDPSRAMDAFIKIERKSKKESDKTVVNFIAAYAGEIPEDKLKSGTSAAVGATAAATGGMVLKGLHPGIELRTWEKNMLDEQAALKKEEKKLEDLKKDQVEMEKKIKQLQTDLETNAKAQTTQSEVISKKRSDVNDLLSKRPGGSDKN